MQELQNEPRFHVWRCLGERRQMQQVCADSVFVFVYKTHERYGPTQSKHKTAFYIGFCILQSIC